MRKSSIPLKKPGEAGKLIERLMEFLDEDNGFKDTMVEHIRRAFGHGDTSEEVGSAEAAVVTDKMLRLFLSYSAIRVKEKNYHGLDDEALKKEVMSMASNIAEYLRLNPMGHSIN